MKPCTCFRGSGATYADALRVQRVASPWIMTTPAAPALSRVGNVCAVLSAANAMTCWVTLTMSGVSSRGLLPTSLIRPTGSGVGRVGKRKSKRRAYGMRTGLRVLMTIIMYLIIAYFITAGAFIALALAVYLGMIGG